MSAATLGSIAIAFAQTAAVAPAQTDPKDEKPVRLEAFEVVMTQDNGYHSPYAGSALRPNEEIMKVPQSITVLTRDIIDDIASIVSAQHAAAIDPSQPRTASLIATVRF